MTCATTPEERHNDQMHGEQDDVPQDAAGVRCTCALFMHAVVLPDDAVHQPFSVLDAFKAVELQLPVLQAA